MKISEATSITVEAIKAAMQANASGMRGRDAQYVIPYWQSGPGLGKTTALRDIAKSMGLEPITLIGSQYDPAELAGWALPVEGGDRMKRSIPDWFPDGSVPTLLILDELVQSTTAVQNIMAQMTNEHRVGSHKLPMNCYLVGAGNRTSDKAGTTTMPTHLRDRLLFLDIEADLEDTVAYFNRVGVDERVVGYLRHRPDFLHEFDRDADACPSPRSWERVGTIVQFAVNPLCMSYALMGQVGKKAASDFLSYLRVVARMPDIDQVIANPTTAEVPTDPALKHAVCAALSRRMNDNNAASILTYMRRIPNPEFAAFVMKDAMNRDGTLKQNNAVRQWVLNEGKALVL